MSDAQDRPELVPPETNAADAAEQQARAERRRQEWREDQAFLRRLLHEDAGQRFVWNILRQAGAFEERYGHINGYAHNPEATWSYRGQKDLGLRLYHQWLTLDPVGMAAVVDRFMEGLPREPLLPSRQELPADVPEDPIESGGFRPWLKSSQ